VNIRKADESAEEDVFHDTDDSLEVEEKVR